MRQLVKQILMLIFSILYFCRKVFTRNISRRRVSKVLVLDLMGIGDVVCLTPFLKSLNDDEELSVWGCFPKSYIGLVDGLVNLDGTIGHVSYPKTIKDIRKEHFDLIIIPGWALRHSIVALLSCKRILGYITSFSKEYISSFEFQSVGYEITSKTLDMKNLHLAHRSDVILDALGANPVKTECRPTSVSRSNIVIHAGADFEGRRWPTVRFAEMINLLVAEYNFKPESFKMVGGPQDKELNSQILKACKFPITDLAGKLNLKETRALIEASSLFIGNDSGPMHIAWVSGVKTIALMGPNLPSISGPLGSKSKALFHQQPCSPCNQTGCPYSYKCIYAIEITQVVETILSLMEIQCTK
ncbi:MAG: glycosyltransferase family 9 protein [Candidatus Zophobacter franzmannii]|nr:glycosyltransferase family 9 protein [Candidatus Zophobacter franzmannii]